MKEGCLWDRGDRIFSAKLDRWLMVPLVPPIWLGLAVRLGCSAMVSIRSGG